MIELLSNMIEQVRNYGIERVFKRYYSVYRAQVTVNIDPEKRGHIKVKVPALFDDNELSVWAEPRDFRGTGKGYGEFYPPQVDDWVFIEFEGGDSRFPIYSGGWYGEGQLPADFKYDATGPVVSGLVTPFGSKILFDESAGKENVSLQIPSSQGGTEFHAISLDATANGPKISVTTAGGHIFILDDTAGKEGVYLIHSAGSQLQIDHTGTLKAFTAQGNFANLDGTTGTSTVASSDGALVNLDKGFTASDSTGASLVTITADGVQVTTSKDLIVQANTTTVTSGSVILDGGKAKLSLGSGKVALGNPAVELLDLFDQTLSALLNDPALVMTPAGPSSGLLGTAKIQLTLVKAQLSLIKGSL